MRMAQIGVWLGLTALTLVVNAEIPPRLLSVIATPSHDASGVGNVTAFWYHVTEEPERTGHCPLGSVLDPHTCTCRELLCPEGRQLSGNLCRKRWLTFDLPAFSVCLDLAVRLSEDNGTESVDLPHPRNASTPLQRFHGYQIRLVDVVKETLDIGASGLSLGAVDFRSASLACHERSSVLRQAVFLALIPRSSLDVNRMEERLLALSASGRSTQGLKVNMSLLPNGECRRTSPEAAVELEGSGCGNVSLKAWELGDFNFYSRVPDLIPFDALSACAHLELQAKEFLLSSDHHALHVRATGGVMTSPFFSVENDVARVCVTQYLHDASNFTQPCAHHGADVITVSLTDVTQSTGPDDVALFGGVAGVLSIVCTCISVTSLITALVTYCTVRRLRTAMGACHATFITTLMLAQVASQLGNSLTSTAKSPAWACVVVGLATHGLWLSTALWLHVCTALAFYSLANPISAAANLTSASRVLVASLAYCLVLPVTLLVASVGASYSLYGEIGYGGAGCFVMYAVCRRFFFALPLGFIVIVNITLFIYRLAKIRSMCGGSGSEEVHGACIGACAQLSLVLGLAWLLSYLHGVTGLWWVGVVATLHFGLHGPLVLVGLVGGCRSRRARGCHSCCPNPRGSPVALTQRRSASSENISLETST